MHAILCTVHVRDIDLQVVLRSIDLARADVQPTTPARCMHRMVRATPDFYYSNYDAKVARGAAPCSSPCTAHAQGLRGPRAEAAHDGPVTNTFSHWTIVCGLDETQRQGVLSVHLCHVSSCRAGRPGPPRAAGYIVTRSYSWIRQFADTSLHPAGRASCKKPLGAPDQSLVVVIRESCASHCLSNSCI